MSLLVKWNTPSNRLGTRRSIRNLHVSRTERPSGQRPVPANIDLCRQTLACMLVQYGTIRLSCFEKSSLRFVVWRHSV
jgi:hypothetical protein